MSVIPPRVEVQVNEINAPGQARVGSGPAPFRPTSPQPIPEIGETLQVRNVGTSMLRFMWNSRTYEIPPGGSDFMPFDGVKVYAGDPRATNVVRTMKDPIGIVSFLPDRATEVRRLRLLYSAPFGEYMTASDVGGIFVSSPDDGTIPRSHAWEGVRIPQIEVYNIRNERILTVLDDPDGNASIPVQVTQAQMDRSDQFMAVIDQQRTLIEVMADRLGIDPNSSALDNTPNVTGEQPPEEPEMDLPEAEPIERNDDGTPKLVYDTRSDEVKQKKRTRTTDPTSFDDLPEDRS